jgi:hydrogenase/urease accessory protein HupE
MDAAMKRAAGILVLIILAASIPAAAHPVPYSYVDVKLSGTAIEASLVLHIYDVAHDLAISPIERLLDPSVVSASAGALRELMDPRFALDADGTRVRLQWLAPEVVADRQSIRITGRAMLPSQPALLAVIAGMFPYDPLHQTFVNVYERDALMSQFILDANHTRTEYLCGSGQGALAVMRRFIPSGMRHILIGPDHLLFLIGLLLLGGTTRKLLTIVTAFTLAHSVTLSVAALNVFNPPAGLIEPAIALSIVIVGADNLMSQGGRDVRAWIALTFGFIHGFGFANVLREMALPARALGWSLFSFNFGVEIGQLLVVIPVALAFSALRSRNERAGRQLAFAGSIVVMISGAYWFVQRVFFPGI